MLCTMELQELHDSVICQVLQRCSPRSKALVSGTCSKLQSALSAPENWTELSFEDAASQSGLYAEDLLRLLRRSKGKVEKVDMAK